MAIKGAEQATLSKEARSRARGLFLQLPVFKWAAKDNYIKHPDHFEMEIMNIFLIKHSDITDPERV